MENQQVKVLAVVYKLMPAGLENRLMDILRNIDSSRVRIDVFTYQLEPGVYDDEVIKLGGTVYYNPPLTVNNMLRYVSYFKKFLKNHAEYRIVHAHQDAWCSVFCKGAYLAGVPVRIAHSRTAVSTKGISSIVKNVIKLPTKKYANYYFAVSKKAGRWLFGEKMCKQGRVQIWPNAIDSSKFRYNLKTRDRVRRECGWKNEYVIMHVGNFTPPKNHKHILKVFKEINQLDDEAILVLVGGGDKSAIEKYVNENNLQAVVKFMGRREDVSDLLQAADVFFFPSLFEGLPGALVEAQAAGLPCVYSDTIADEVRLTPDNTVLALTDSISTWCECIEHYKGFRRYDTHSYIESRGFDVKKLTDTLCQFYEKSIEKE